MLTAQLEMGAMHEAGVHRRSGAPMFIAAGEYD